EDVDLVAELGDRGNVADIGVARVPVDARGARLRKRGIARRQRRAAARARDRGGERERHEEGEERWPHPRRSSGTTSPSRMYLRGSTENAARNVASKSGGAIARSPSLNFRVRVGRSCSGSLLPKTRPPLNRGEITSAELLG